MVKYTLEPLVYVGPAEGKPKDDWKLKSAKELLDLKICDMACGSGAFLVQVDRYMAERLLEAWDAVKQANPSTPGITPEGTPSTGKANERLIPDDPIERKTYAMRIIAQRCLYGVDKNPLAAEMAKLSLWLLTLAKDIGLAKRGFTVTACDLSHGAITRAKVEAQRRGVEIDFSVCDMRVVHAYHQRQFEVVISADNSITHLLNDDDLLLALREMFACTRPGGGCLLTLRDYDREERGTGLVKPYGIRAYPSAEHTLV